MAAEIERELISMRTTEALAKRKAAGKTLGRPKGKQSAKLKLDAREQEIKMYLAKGISKRSIAKLGENYCEAEEIIPFVLTLLRFRYR